MPEDRGGEDRGGEDRGSIRRYTEEGRIEAGMEDSRRGVGGMVMDEGPIRRAAGPAFNPSILRSRVAEVLQGLAGAP